MIREEIELTRFLCNLIDKQENDYIKDKSGYNFAKQEKLNKIIKELDYMKLRSTEKLFHEIKDLALSEGGFIKNEFRRVIWKQLLFLQNSMFSDSYVFIKNNLKDNLNDFDGCNIFEFSKSAYNSSILLIKITRSFYQG